MVHSKVAEENTLSTSDTENEDGKARGYVRYDSGGQYASVLISKFDQDPDFVTCEVAGKGSFTKRPARFDLSRRIPKGRELKIHVSAVADAGDSVKIFHGNTRELLQGDNPFRYELQSSRDALRSSPTKLESAMDREQISDMISASEARTDAKLERIIGEIRVIAGDLRSDIAATGGKLDAMQSYNSGTKATIITTGIGVFGFLAALILAMFAYGDAIFSRGMSVRDVVKSVVEEQRDQAKTLKTP